MNKLFQLCTIIVLGLGLTEITAQESVNATGGNASGSGGSASFSFGQVAYTTISGINGLVAQGVQQPFEISIVTGIEQAKGIDLSVNAYPNPATDYLTLSISEFDILNLSYQVYDMQGKLLENKNITGNQTSIDMSNLVSATYFVKVFRLQDVGSMLEIKTFKIIKTQ
jgi:hypothetical protein